MLVSRGEDYVGKLLTVDAVPGVTEAALEAALATPPADGYVRCEKGECLFFSFARDVFLGWRKEEEDPAVGGVCGPWQAY